jgi:hypothetical protein
MPKTDGDAFSLDILDALLEQPTYPRRSLGSRDWPFILPWRAYLDAGGTESNEPVKTRTHMPWPNCWVVGCPPIEVD